MIKSAAEPLPTKTEHDLVHTEIIGGNSHNKDRSDLSLLPLNHTLPVIALTTYEGSIEGDNV